MKKILSVLIVSAIFMQISVFSPAYAKDGNWEIGYYGEYASDDMRGNHNAEISGANAYDGDKALSVKSWTNVRNEENYVEALNDFSTIVSPGEYTLKFYVKKNSRTTGEPDIIIGETVVSGSEMTKTPVENNWIEYSKEIVSESDADKIVFRFYDYIQLYVIDNISFISDTGADFVVDGGFEEYYVPIVEEEYDTTPYQPWKILFSPSADSVGLSWQNPLTDELTGVKVYDITSGDEILIYDDIPAEPGAYVYRKVENLKAGVYYQYKIVFSFSTKSDYIYFLGGAPDSSMSKKAGQWSLTRNRVGTAGYCPGEIYIDSNVSYDGDASLRFMSNVNLGVDEFKSNIYLMAQRGIDMKDGSRYKISYMVKTDKLASDFQTHMNWNAFEGMDSLYTRGYTGTNDWQKIEYEYVYTSDKSNGNILTFLHNNLCDGLWIDNVECYEIDADGNVISENLVDDGDFENLVIDDAVEIQNGEAYGDVASLTLEWDKPGSNYTGANLYQLMFGEYEYRGKISAGLNSFTINGLKQGEEYTYKVVPVNNDGIEGKGIELTGKTLMADYMINLPVLKKGGAETEEITESGSYTVSVSAKNNTVEDGLNYVVLAALYDKNDVRVKIYKTESMVKKKDKDAPYSESRIIIDVPDGDGYYLEVYTMDSTKNLELYNEPVVFN